MALFNPLGKSPAASELRLAYKDWRRLQILSGQTVDLPPGPQVETMQDLAFDACERAERALLRLKPRSNDDVVVLIDVLLGNEEVACLGGPTLRRIRAYLAPPLASASRARQAMRRPAGGRVAHCNEARLS